jgi:hypothetical protein
MAANKTRSGERTAKRTKKRTTKKELSVLLMRSAAMVKKREEKKRLEVGPKCTCLRLVRKGFQKSIQNKKLPFVFGTDF